MQTDKSTFVTLQNRFGLLRIVESSVADQNPDPDPVFLDHLGKKPDPDQNFPDRIQ